MGMVSVESVVGLEPVDLVLQEEFPALELRDVLVARRGPVDGLVNLALEGFVLA
jgi:hypothetical protein